MAVIHDDEMPDASPNLTKRGKASVSAKALKSGGSADLDGKKKLEVKKVHWLLRFDFYMKEWRDYSSTAANLISYTFHSGTL